VYAAIDQTTEKRVAVKIYSHQIVRDRGAREKFQLEVRVAGRVESEHIVQVLDANVDPMTQFPFMVMEFLNGTDLQQLVAQKGPLAPALAVEYLTQIALGLDKVHACKDHDGKAAPIVHRDLKPENLCLTHREDGTPLVKIIDFGIAKVLSGSATWSGDLKGTPLYMAPEQLSHAPVTPATDIWALGLVAFYLLTGRCYWKSAERADAVLPAVLREVCEGPVVPPRARMRELGVAVSLPPAFDQWFTRCVALDPARRYPQAGEAVRALAVALGLVTADANASGGGAAASLPPPVENGTPDTFRSSPPGFNLRRGLLWLALGALIVVGLSLFWPRRKHSGQSSQLPLSANSQVATVSSPSQPEPVLPAGPSSDTAVPAAAGSSSALSLAVPTQASRTRATPRLSVSATPSALTSDANNPPKKPKSAEPVLDPLDHRSHRTNTARALERP
jgi:serine/threonine-protein kinase